MPAKNKFKLFITAIASLAALLTSLQALNLIYLDPWIIAGIRWGAIFAIGVPVYKRKNLTTWILFSMIIGAEFGHDFPTAAVELKVVSQVFIGLVAINISKAGVGIILPPHSDAEKLSVPPPSGIAETILHIFPENIAKSIAEGQVLQIVVFSILFAIGLALVKEP